MKRVHLSGKVIRGAILLLGAVIGGWLIVPAILRSQDDSQMVEGIIVILVGYGLVAVLGLLGVIAILGALTD